MQAKKILVLSDSHGHLGFIADILRIELDNVDIVAHLGDTWFDMKPFVRQIKEKQKEIIMVRGNIDELRGDPTTPFIPEVENLEINGKKVMLTHGHLFEAHNSLEKLKFAAFSNGSKIVLFGHTHQPLAKEINGILFFNPGAVRDGIYGIVVIGETISYKHFRLKNPL
jgi:putative phosphoesterase